MIDRSIWKRLAAVTGIVWFLLILVFIIIDFSEHSDDFADRGASLPLVWNAYYLPYIPEIIRLVGPVAVFTACLLVTGMMTQRMEWHALKASGVSLYRFLRPFLVFGGSIAVLIWVLDGFVIPPANAKRLAFEREYIHSSSDRVEQSTIYRQDSRNSILSINFYAPQDSTAYRVTTYQFDGERLAETMSAERMKFRDSTSSWVLHEVKRTRYGPTFVHQTSAMQVDTVLGMEPRDLARTTNDIYQLTYPDVRQYLATLERIGVAGIEQPTVQYFGRLWYPLSILIVTVIGVCVASIRFKGGTGVHLGAGLTVSFLYLVFMKLIEPFGYAGIIPPLLTVALPHLFFGAVALVLLRLAPK